VSECVHSRVNFGRVQYSVIGRGVTCLREEGYVGYKL